MRMFYDEKLGDYICCAGKPALCVQEVTARPDHTLLLTFSNGERRVYDARQIMTHALFAPLRDPAFFMTARCDGCTVTWDGELDIAPEALYEQGVPLTQEDSLTVS